MLRPKLSAQNALNLGNRSSNTVLGRRAFLTNVGLTSATAAAGVLTASALDDRALADDQKKKIASQLLGQLVVFDPASRATFIGPVQKDLASGNIIFSSMLQQGNPVPIYEFQIDATLLSKLPDISQAPATVIVPLGIDPTPNLQIMIDVDPANEDVATGIIKDPASEQHLDFVFNARPGPEPGSQSADPDLFGIKLHISLPGALAAATAVFNFAVTSIAAVAIATGSVIASAATGFNKDPVWIYHTCTVAAQRSCGTAVSETRVFTQFGNPLTGPVFQVLCQYRCGGSPDVQTVRLFPGLIP